MLFAEDGGRMILLAQQVKKSTLTSSARYKQIIDKPTYVVITIRHTLTLYFVLTTVSNYGADVSIFDKCHHDINFGKIKIHEPLPPVYFRKVWNYSQANKTIL